MSEQNLPTRPESGVSLAPQAGLAADPTPDTPVARAKRKYPENRKRANRTRDSYRAKSPEARARQLAGLVQGRGKRRKWKPEQKPIVPQLKKKLSREDLQGLNIVQVAEDVLGLKFDERPAQRAILKAMYGLALTGEELELYRQLTGNEIEFEAHREKGDAVWAIGARAGKSTLASVIAVFEATRNKWKQYLQDGETGYAVIIGTRQQQAADIIGANCARLLEGSRIAHWVKESWSTTLMLSNGMCIASYPCNSTAARGLPIFLLIFDEIAHFRTEGIKADETIYSGLRPRQAQFPGAKCLKISTPAAKQGLFWDEFRQGFQVPGRLTIQAPTRTVNPLIPQSFIDSEYARDPDNAQREFGAQFAETVNAYLPFDKLDACFTLAGDLLPDHQHRYFAGIDQSGLAGRDRFAFSIAHRDGEIVMVDCTRAWDTTDADMILGEIKHLAHEYGLDSVMIDRYGAGWVQQALEKIGLAVQVRDALPAVYQNFKTLVLANAVRLPDDKPLRDGLSRTQAYYGRNNTLSISHERSIAGHADLADAVVTAVWVASSRQAGGYFSDVLQ